MLVLLTLPALLLALLPPVAVQVVWPRPSALFLSAALGIAAATLLYAYAPVAPGFPSGTVLGDTWQVVPRLPRLAGLVGAMLIFWALHLAQERLARPVPAPRLALALFWLFHLSILADPLAVVLFARRTLRRGSADQAGDLAVLEAVARASALVALVALGGLIVLLLVSLARRLRPRG